MELNLNLDIQFENDKNGEILCFTHAVQEAMKGTKINIKIDDENDFALSCKQAEYCARCDEE